MKLDTKFSDNWPQFMGLCIGLILGSICYKLNLSGWYYLGAIFVGGAFAIGLIKFLRWLKPSKVNK